MESHSAQKTALGYRMALPTALPTERTKAAMMVEQKENSKVQPTVILMALTMAQPTERMMVVMMVEAKEKSTGQTKEKMRVLTTAQQKENSKAPTTHQQTAPTTALPMEH